MGLPVFIVNAFAVPVRDHGVCSEAQPLYTRVPYGDREVMCNCHQEDHTNAPIAAAPIRLARE